MRGRPRPGAGRSRRSGFTGISRVGIAGPSLRAGGWAVGAGGAAADPRTGVVSPGALAKLDMVQAGAVSSLGALGAALRVGAVLIAALRGAAGFTGVPGRIPLLFGPAI